MRSKPSVGKPVKEAARSAYCFCTTSGATSRSARDRSRARHASKGRCSTMATTGLPWRAAIASRLRRESRSTLVASTTVSLPLRRRFPVMSRSTSKASLEADWSASSSDTAARSASDDTISVLLKCFRAKVDFPHPDAPTNRISAFKGMFKTTLLYTT